VVGMTDPLVRNLSDETVAAIELTSRPAR
jgi:hypothetical protein